MSKVNDGGSAFPSHGTMGEVVQEGMTVRQWFAGQALVGLLGNPIVAGRFDLVCKEYARVSYELADTMIAYEEAEREKGK